MRAKPTAQESQTQAASQYPHVRIIVAAIATAFLLSMGTARRAQAQSFSVLHSFDGTPSDGAIPRAELIRDSAGNLYGTSSQGGADNAGAVFKLDTSGNLTTLHSFSGTDGATPVAGLVMDSSGNLYGTTSAGGSSFNGTVFKLDTSGANFAVLHNFLGGDDGAHPYAGLILDASNYLYGTTRNAGSSGYGTVFKLDTSGNNFAVLHNFSGSDGANPEAGVVMDSSGNLYGTARFGGGSSDIGAVFTLDTSGNNFAVLHTFAGSPDDGAYPYASLILDASNNLYGTTGRGGANNNGIVFKLDTSGNNFVLLHSFTISDGTIPEAGLIADASGNLYGTTYSGGSQGKGTVFKLDTAGGNFAVMHDFSGSDGANPQAGLLMDPSGNLFGTASAGGSSTNCGGGCGTAFEFSTTPQASIQAIIDQVNALYSQGVLNIGQAHSLETKLEHAARKLDAGNLNPAIGNLESFINEVNALLNARVLTSEQGAGLITAANNLVMQIQAM